MCDTQNNCTLPENADKILFAEDLMNDMLRRFELPLLPSEIADYRDFIHNYFDEDERDVTNCVFEELKEEMAKEIEYILESITIHNMDNFFSIYAIALRIQTLNLMRPNKCPSRLQSLCKFTEFCVRISTLAGIFYIDGVRGFQDAPCIAVDNIIYVFEHIRREIPDIFESTSDSSSDSSDDGTIYSSSSDSSTPNNSYSDHTSDHFSNWSANTDNSEDSCSSDHKIDVGHDQDEQPKPLIVDDFSEMKSSESARSPDHAMAVGVDQDEQPEELTNNNLCERCIAAMSSSSEGPASSSSICKHVEKTIEVKTENTVSISDNASDSVSSGSPKETSSEDDTSKEKKRRKKMKFSKDSDSD